MRLCSGRWRHWCRCWFTHASENTGWSIIQLARRHFMFFDVFMKKCLHHPYRKCNFLCTECNSFAFQMQCSSTITWGRQKPSRRIRSVLRVCVQLQLHYTKGSTQVLLFMKVNDGPLWRLPTVVLLRQFQCCQYWYHFSKAMNGICRRLLHIGHCRSDIKPGPFKDPLQWHSITYHRIRWMNISCVGEFMRQ
jgi:hypothetical protein